MFAPGPRAVGFTIVWPEGVIFRSMMTYQVQFLLLVLAGWVNPSGQNTRTPSGSVVCTFGLGRLGTGKIDTGWEGAKRGRT